MKITTLVENQAFCNVKAVHGLAFYIQTEKHKILFDVGPDSTIIQNSKTLNIDLSQVDTVIISHGHNDHGGALHTFLQHNSTAKIYIKRQAFENHYSFTLGNKRDIGLDKSLMTHKQVVLLNDNYTIDSQLQLFSPKEQFFHSEINDTLYENNNLDSFTHEQNLLITENGKNTVIIGCGHSGVVSILNKAVQLVDKRTLKACVGGFHLYSASSNKTACLDTLNGIADQLALFDTTEFYTCHCTGKVATQFLSQKVKSLCYISCGQSIDI